MGEQTETSITLTDVINHEMNESYSNEINYLISSPIRRDGTPSFRLYSNGGGAYDFGTGKSYNIFSFIHDLYKHQNWGETIEYVQNTYKISYSKEQYEGTNNALTELMKIIVNSNYANTVPKIKQLELAIMSFVKGDEVKIRDIVDSMLEDGL